MKKFSSVVLGMILLAFSVNAQNKAKGPIYISKDVQRIQYKEPVHPVKVVTGDVATYSSKGIAMINNKVTTHSKQVVVRATPAWTISKGVARLQVEKNSVR